MYPHVCSVLCDLRKTQVRKFVLFLPNILVLFCVLCYLSQPYLNTSIKVRDVNVFFLPLLFKRKRVFFFQKNMASKKTFFFANFVASGNTDCALLFPGF